MHVARYIAFAAILLGSAGIGYAQKEEEFEEYLHEQQRAFKAYEEKVTREFEAYLKAERQAFERFKAEVERQWREYIGSTEKDWVEYSSDRSSRSRVDFEKGEAKVEVLVSTNSGEDVTPKLEQAVVKLVTDKGTSSDYSVTLPDGTVDTPKPLGKEPVLSDQLQTADGRPVTVEEAEEFAKEVVRKQPVEREKVVGKDGKERLRLSVTFPLVPDHLRRRAERYVSSVKRHATRFELNPPLVFAVIHTESYFNPKAKSPAPAYGLMQLVPVSGGRTAYLHVYRKDQVLPPSYFYVPENNIELGCGYLNYLRTLVFRDVQDDRKATYCIVAAYNTGPGNVGRAIGGSFSLDQTIPLIQGMTPEVLYAKLREDLPYAETRNYIQRVTERVSLYAEWR